MLLKYFIDIKVTRKFTKVEKNELNKIFHNPVKFKLDNKH